MNVKIIVQSTSDEYLEEESEGNEGKRSSSALVARVFLWGVNKRISNQRSLVERNDEKSVI
jgi:hypothetical protein